MRNIFARLKRFNTKDVMVISAFLVALTGAAGLGFATKQFTSAAGVRDTGTNPILNQGSIGCLSVSECVADFKANKPGDIQSIYSNRGLSASEYKRFADTAVKGTAYKDGRLVAHDPVLGNVTVANDIWSMGRNTWAGQREPIHINGKKYYMSPSSSSFVSNSIDAFIMFDKKGQIEFALLTACGNPVWGKEKTPEYGCKTLNKTAVSGKKDTYSFTTSLNPSVLAKVNKVVYEFGDGTTKTETSPSKAVTHTYTKPGEYTAKVTVYFNIPGKQVVSSTSVKCTTKVTVKPKEEPKKPVYACSLLMPSVLNDEKTKFRFTVKTSQANGATLKDVDFTVNGTSTVTGVTEKDGQGNIFKEYEFPADNQERTITVKVKFMVNGQTVVAPDNVKCVAKVTPEKTPECKPGIPIGHPDCEDEVEECKPGVPVGHPDCEETPPEQPPVEELPSTGMGSVLGIFAGTTAAGAVAHRWFMNRRSNG
jgi:PKD domain-containing protein